MRALAARFPDKLHFYPRGYPSVSDAAGIAALLEGLPNLEWSRAYQYPGDLADIYGQIDFNWTFDFADAGANSTWLLPNRIYEGGLFACPALADASTETGQWVPGHAAGWTLREPFASTPATFLEILTEFAWQEKQATCTQLPHRLTCGEADSAALSADLTKLAGGAKWEPSLQP